MSFWSDLWGLFFPQCCILCGKRLSAGEEHLCFQCLAALPKTRMHLYSGNEIEKAMWGRLPVGRAAAFLYYAKGGDVRKLMYELKYYGNTKLGSFLGRWMASELRASGFFEGIDFVLPVPLHSRKLRKRGYNQSEMLADGVSAVCGIPVLKDLLKKVQDTQTQTHKGVYDRWANVEKAFECTSPQALEGKHILLVDDVMTTGATLVACADALGQVPGLKISILTFAWARES